MARLRYMENARTGDAGTICTHTNKLFFDDTGAYINASASGTLALVATTVAVTGNQTISGDLDVTGALSYGSETISLNQSLLGTLTVGVNDTGYDVKFYGEGSGYYFLWDEDQDTNGGVTIVGTVDITGATAIVGNTTITGTLSVSSTSTLTGNVTLAADLFSGTNNDGNDVTFYGDASSGAWKWVYDQDTNGGVLLVGSFLQTGDMTLTGTLTVGVSATGHDVLFYGDNSTYQWKWVQNADTNGGVIMKGTWTCVGAVGITGATSITGAVGIIGKMTISPATTGTFLDFELDTEWTSGTLINADFSGASTTFGSPVVGINLDLGANIVATSEQAVTGIDINLPQMTATALTKALYGVLITAQGAFTLASSGTCTWDGVNITMPAITETAGSLITSGLKVTGGTLTSGSQYGLYISGKFTSGIYIANAVTTDSGLYGIYVADTFTLTTGGVHKAISGEVTYATGYATSIGVAGKTTLTGTFGAVAAGYMWGIQGQAHLGASAVMSDSGCIITALRAVLTDDSSSCLTGTKGYLTCFTAGSLLESNFVTTEWKSIIRIGNWGANSNFCTFDSEIEIYGRHTDNLFCFYDCIGVADSFISTAGGTTHSGTVKKIACVDQNGDTWYLLLSSAIS